MATKSPTGNPLGRPKKQKQKNPVGRPKGEATIMKEYRQRMLASPRSAKVMDAIFEAALDHDHKNQAAAWKIIADRILPVSGFEKDAGGSGRTKMVVEIKDAGVVQLSTESAQHEDVMEADFEELRGDPKEIKDVAQKPRVVQQESTKPQVVFVDPPSDGLKQHPVTPTGDRGTVTDD